MAPLEVRTMRVQVGERFVTQVTLSASDVAEFARRCGDLNPLHHDETYARGTRFGAIIASGPHLSSLMMALTASHFSRNGAMLGLEFCFRFVKAVRAGEGLELAWSVVATEPKPSLGGEIVSLEGQATNVERVVVVTATGKVLVAPSLQARA
jgi:acyl dehydratase